MFLPFQCVAERGGGTDDGAGLHADGGGGTDFVATATADAAFGVQSRFFCRRLQAEGFNRAGFYATLAADAGGIERGAYPEQGRDEPHQPAWDQPGAKGVGHLKHFGLQVHQRHATDIKRVLCKRGEVGDGFNRHAQDAADGVVERIRIG